MSQQDDIKDYPITIERKWISKEEAKQYWPDSPNPEFMGQSDYIKEYKVVRSKSDKHPDFGYPMGQILCNNIYVAHEHIKNSEFKDCYIEDYNKNAEKS